MGIDIWLFKMRWDLLADDCEVGAVREFGWVWLSKALNPALNRVHEEKEVIQAKTLFLKNPLASFKIFNRDYYMMVMD